MKKQLSKRIGAILTMTAMLMTLIPMAIPAMATGETETNLITNGDFSDEADALTGWTKVEANSGYVTVFTKTNNTVGLEAPALQIKGKSGNGVSQIVKEMTAEKSYALSMELVNSSSRANAGILATVTFGKYDGTAFTSLADSADYTADFEKSVKFKMYANTDNTKKNVTMNFTLPPTANAAEIKLTCSSSGSSTGYVLVDSIKLVECSQNIEMINNGSIECSSGGAAEGWTTKSGTSGAEIPFTTTHSDSYIKLTDVQSVNAYYRQALSLRHSKLYKLSFDFAHSGLGDSVVPSVKLDIQNANGITDAVDVSPAYTGAGATTGEEINWKTYEAYITLDKPATDYAYDLVDVNLDIQSIKIDSWPEGAAVYYDNISLVEVDKIDEADKMAFAAGENGEFTTEATDAKAASCIFVQGETPTVQKFIVAKYNSTTDALESATVVNAGEGIAAGNAKRYDVEIADDAASYYRIFLWDGTTLKPVLNSEDIGR